jgi:hypothetical protein
MFDTFILTTPVQCPRCQQGSYSDFQTKQFDCLLEYYYEGKPAVQYMWAELTREEYLNEVQMHHILYGADTFLPFFRNDSDVIAKKLNDGEYYVYDHCDICNETFGITVIVKNGIFVGIKEKRGMEI